MFSCNLLRFRHNVVVIVVAENRVRWIRIIPIVLVVFIQLTHIFNLLNIYWSLAIQCQTTCMSSGLPLIRTEFVICFRNINNFGRCRSVLLQQQRNLEDMRDMAASRASLSGLCLESPNESRITSPDATTNGKFTTQKSYDSMSETVGLNLIT